MNAKIKSREEMKKVAQKLKAEGKKLVATSGCFDILHAGHVTYLKQAREKGDALLLLLNSDSSVRGLKGDKRPIVMQEDRATVLAALECISYICFFDESTPCESLMEIKPAAFIKGGDYEGKHIPEMDIMDRIGGVVEYVSIVEGRSSTNIIERILEVYR